MHGPLYAVSCPSSSMCMAVGWHSATRWDGAGWTSDLLPKPDGGDWTVLGVDCPSITMCVAVGRGTPSAPGSRSVPLFEQWDGTNWQIMSFAPPRGPGDIELRDVSCSSVNLCVAVGSTWEDGFLWPVVARWDGGAWSVADPPIDAVPSSPGWLLGVSCPGTADCVVVGADMNTNPGGVIAFKTDGRRIQKMHPVIPSYGYLSMFRDVSCTAPDQCVAVGAENASSLTPTPLIERFDGSEWSLVGVPAAENDGDRSFQDVSCASASSCVAVGGSSVIRWDGVAWRWEQRSPQEMPADWEVYGVSCISAGACTAVGEWPHSGRSFAERSEG